MSWSKGRDSAVAERRRPWNPLRSEADAYQFLILVVGYFVAIALASVLGGEWAGLAVFIVLTVTGTLWILRRGRTERPVPQAPVRHGREDERRILVVANETVAGDALRREIERLAAGVAGKVLVVSPALNSPLRHWTSDEDDARARAQR